MIKTTKSEKRFEGLLSGTSTAQHDQTLLRGSGWIVAPTLGAIIPNWLLIIPEKWELNFRDWGNSSATSPLSIVTELAGHLGLQAKDYIWFEHGPNTTGSITGCGLDHAHLHVLIRPNFEFCDFEATVKRLSKLDWVETAVEDCYAKIQPNSSYLVAGWSERAIIATDVESAGSQFFRRAISKMCDVKERWNYRTHAHANNIDETIQTFERLVNAR